ncbi:DUF2771 domain-containing protein [Streptomyces diacarni]|uniref:DUF2771 domain-containing protein n=2 Tax=Streptomyces TaxID=1883 RepID=A0A367FCL7_9ACTN|nr:MULTISPECIES: DUF2771 domain-containing protein [Streptomyces]RCG28116.1 DUF2771 domain-containing protein [Streptomyces diacarni]UNS97607.1 DUF2771 domain-containing protein [Streptomyces tubbatahanensis]
MSKLARQGRMSSQSRRGVRTASALGAASLGLVALSACEQPSPMVTATVGGDSVSTEAACYDDGKAIPQDEVRKCLGKKADETISVSTGDKLRIGVDPKTADDGWLVLVDGKPALSEPLNKTYYSFQGEVFFQQASASGQPSAPKKSVQVTVVQTSGGDFNGIWHLNLKNSKK